MIKDLELLTCWLPVLHSKLGCQLFILTTNIKIKMILLFCIKDIKPFVKMIKTELN